MEAVTQIQILDDTVSILFWYNALGKGINQFILPADIGK